MANTRNCVSRAIRGRKSRLGGFALPDASGKTCRRRPPSRDGALARSHRPDRSAHAACRPGAGSGPAERPPAASCATPPPRAVRAGGAVVTPERGRRRAAANRGARRWRAGRGARNSRRGGKPKPKKRQKKPKSRRGAAEAAGRPRTARSRADRTGPDLQGARRDDLRAGQRPRRGSAEQPAALQVQAAAAAAAGQAER